MKVDALAFLLEEQGIDFKNFDKLMVRAAVMGKRTAEQLREIL